MIYLYNHTVFDGTLSTDNIISFTLTENDSIPKLQIRHIFQMKNTDIFLSSPGKHVGTD